MERKHKIWISAGVHTINFSRVTEGLHPKTEEYRMADVLSRYVQTALVRCEIEGLIMRHKDIELKGYYISGSKYYIELLADWDNEKYIDELPISCSTFLPAEPMLKMNSRPRIGYRKIDINEEYERLKRKVDEYKDI